jgi:hypothetical protein
LVYPTHTHPLQLLLEQFYMRYTLMPAQITKRCYVFAAIIEEC